MTALNMAMKALAKVDAARWLVYEVANTEEEQPIAWECDNCGEVVGVKYDFCPNCGSVMEAKR